MTAEQTGPSVPSALQDPPLPEEETPSVKATLAGIVGAFVLMLFGTGLETVAVWVLANWVGGVDLALRESLAIAIYSIFVLAAIRGQR